MIRSFVISKKDEYRHGQVIQLLDQSPSPEEYDQFKIIKLITWNPQTKIGEFQVEPIKQPKDANNLKGWIR